VPTWLLFLTPEKQPATTVKWGQDNSSSTLSEEKPAKQHVFALNIYSLMRDIGTSQ